VSADKSFYFGDFKDTSGDSVGLSTGKMITIQFGII
jgi:hypothetical protein